MRYALALALILLACPADAQNRPLYGFPPTRPYQSPPPLIVPVEPPQPFMGPTITNIFDGQTQTYYPGGRVQICNVFPGQVQCY